MKTLYITHENIVLHRIYEHLSVVKFDKKIETIPLVNVKTIILFTSCQITSHALSLIFEKNIDIIYISKSGKIKSRMLSASGGDAILRLAQHQAFLCRERKLEIAKQIVSAKIINQKKLILKYKNYYSLENFSGIIKNMEKLSQRVKISDKIDEIMGLEGVSAKFYWTCYKELIINKKFTRRDYRPAPDIINSALNLGYAFLVNEISICLYAEKFDLEIGFLHSILYGRNSLVLDMIEEFRTAFVDAWILKLFNLKTLNENDFKGKEEGFYFTEEGFKKFIDLYHKHLSDGDWRRIFQGQVQIFKESLLNNALYQPYLWN